MRYRFASPSRCLLIAGSVAAAACAGQGDAKQADTTGANARVPRAQRVIRILGFRAPECARYDAEQDVWFVSNVNGGPSAKDFNGYIVRLSGSDPSRTSMFVESGKNGATLHAPKGMLVRGDTLWVVDLEQVVAFDKRTGATLVTVDFSAYQTKFLNDIALGPDGGIYVTDSGIIINEKGTLHPGPDRIFRIGPGHAIEVVAEGDYLGRPNGIMWDAKGQRWVVASFAPLGALIYALRLGDEKVTPIVAGPGKFDGLTLLGGDRMLATAWMDSTVYYIEAGRAHRMIRGLPEPAALGIDSTRHRVAVPLLTSDRVEIWSVAY